MDSKGKAPKPRYKHETVLTPSGSLFVLGGISGEERFLDAFEFNIETHVWSPVLLSLCSSLIPPLDNSPGLYKGRYGFTASPYERHVIIFGVFPANQKR